MQKQYKKKYRNKSIRLAGYDYRSEGLYFITICTKDRICYFGEIDSQGKIHLSKEGEIAYNNWKAIPNHFNYIFLGEFVVMPNHIHGILGINHQNHVETLHCNVNQAEENMLDELCQSLQMSNLSPKQGSISTIIRSYKSASTKTIREQTNQEFAWQPRFYDHIIRNQESLINIEGYIINNPLKWAEDEENPDFIKKM